MERAVMNKTVKRRPDDAVRFTSPRKRLTPARLPSGGAASSHDSASDTINATSRTQPTEQTNDDDILSMRSEDLMGHREKIEILHNGERYVLRLTRLGRLILTK